MQWLALFLPAFALDVHGRAVPAGTPLAVMGQRVLTACNAAAAARGVVPGMAREAALALVSELRLVVRDEAAEAAALANLAAWAGQFSDLVSIEAGQGLVLESGRSLRLFGGGRRLGRRVREGARALGYSARVALAPTARGSWWLAVGTRGACIADAALMGRRLRDLPLAVMDLPAGVAADLAALGLTTVGDVAAQPRDGLARRLGEGVLHRLDEALGRRPEARTPHRPPPRFHGRLELPAPVLEREALLFPLRRLLLELEGVLRAGGTGVTGFEVSLCHDGGGSSRFHVGLAAADHDGHRFLELLRHRLERLELAAPVAGVAVDVAEIRPLAPVTGDLFGAAAGGGERREAVLLDRLTARLGKAAVGGLDLVPDHRPERAWRTVPAATARAVAPPGGPPRPRWLLAEPQPLGAVAGGGALRFIDGPERIEGGWWDGDDVSRDYYVAVTPEGRRLWVFRERRPPRRWLVHGLFA